ncbi:MAG: WbqC family protein [Candidatus Firestonebacteria bacterium]
MIISVHQPQYLPWIGYINKIVKSDAFVFLDNVQYKKREFQNKNKIRTKEGFIWLTVPVSTKNKYIQKIKDVEIDNTVDWKKKHWKSIEINYSKAKYFREHENYLRALYSREWNKLSELNIEIIKYILKYLEIKIPLYYESELDIHGEKTERIINICKKLNSDIYLSGIGANDYLIEEEFQRANVKLIYQDFKHPEYKQIYPNFVSHLTVFDLLFNYGKESKEIILKKLESF